MKPCAPLTGVERACSAATTPDELLASLADEFARAVPHDASIWMAVDPTTMLSTAPSRVDALDATLCDTFWHLEFFEHDTGHFVDLARSGRPVAMRLELGERVGRSPRYRDFMRPQGYGDELRGVFRSGDTAWGAVGLYREKGRPDFTVDEVEVVQASSTIIADALRTHVRSVATSAQQPPDPGLIVVDRDGRAISTNDDGVAWLRLLWPEGASASTLDTFNLFDLRDIELGVPTPLHALVSRARAVANGREATPARLRLRDQQGRWAVLHASAVTGPGPSTDDAVAIIIQAAKRTEIAPLIIDAYGLTPREQDVLGALARGASTAQMAADLFMSPHTVRDHIKTVFAKVGVSSRGELLARLFSEHYADPLHETMVHVN